MNLHYLDSKTVNGRLWVLCKGNLYEYLKGLRTDFFEFSVQRKIVNNVYLDNIYRSIEKGEPFPPITLTYSERILLNCASDVFTIDEKRMEILDGLQRTYRLWIILFFYEIIKTKGCLTAKEIAAALKETTEGQVIIQNSFVNGSFINKLTKTENNTLYIESLLERYKHFDVYFNIWCNLDDQEVIRRMLVLNAGQKSVSSTHQFELLFLHFFEDQKLRYYDDVKLIREKNSRYYNVQRGNRELGEYLMSSIVIALQSFINGKQLRIVTKNRINLDDDKLLNEEKLTKYFNAITLSRFINQVYDLGRLLASNNLEYVKWYGKDTALSGIFGAFGAFMKDQGYETRVEDIGALTLKLAEYDDPFKINEYYYAYDNKLLSTKVNVGNAVRQAIFNYTKDLLALGKSDWNIHFGKKFSYDEE